MRGCVGGESVSEYSKIWIQQVDRGEIISLCHVNDMFFLSSRFMA